jgi:hypothetical protein
MLAKGVNGKLGGTKLQLDPADSKLSPLLSPRPIVHQGKYAFAALRICIEACKAAL